LVDAGNGFEKAQQDQLRIVRSRWVSSEKEMWEEEKRMKMESAWFDAAAVVAAERW
jgi:hypothetical protein